MTRPPSQRSFLHLRCHQLEHIFISPSTPSRRSSPQLRPYACAQGLLPWWQDTTCHPSCPGYHSDSLWYHSILEVGVCQEFPGRKGSSTSGGVRSALTQSLVSCLFVHWDQEVPHRHGTRAFLRPGNFEICWDHYFSHGKCINLYLPILSDNFDLIRTISYIKWDVSNASRLRAPRDLVEFCHVSSATKPMW